MSRDRLTSLQRRCLAALADLQPRWVLTGGAALAGFHLGHRTTRDLDLFFRGLRRLEPETLRAIESRLELAGLNHRRIQSGEAFVRYQIAGVDETVVLDLVAEPVRAVSEPDEVVLQGDSGLTPATIQIDSRHEILVNKLNALVSRTELRDLVDLEALVTDDLTLEGALRDAARKDGGFSPLTLVACLANFPVALLAARTGLDETTTSSLATFARVLSEKVARASFPSRS